MHIDESPLKLLGQFYSKKLCLGRVTLDQLNQQLADVGVDDVAAAKVSQHDVLEVDEGVRVAGEHLHLHLLEQAECINQQVFEHF